MSTKNEYRFLYILHKTFTNTYLCHPCMQSLSVNFCIILWSNCKKTKIVFLRNILQEISFIVSEIITQIKKNNAENIPCIVLTFTIYYILRVTSQAIPQLLLSPFEDFLLSSYYYSPCYRVCTSEICLTSQIHPYR